VRVLLGAAAVCAIAAGPADVSAWAAAYDKPKLGAAVDAAGRQLTWGHVTLTLTSGQLHAVLVGGEPAGIYFKGAGRVRYVSTDALESPIYRRNAERTSAYRVDASGAIEDTMSEALVFASSGLPGGLDISAPPSLQSVTALESHLQRFAYDATPPYRQLMTQARLDPPAQPLVVAEIQAGRDDLFYVHDTVRSGDESIGTLRRVKRLGGHHMGLVTSDKWRLFEPVSSQPIGRPRLGVAPVAWVMRKLDATVVNPRDDRLEVETRQVFEARRRVQVLDLGLAVNFQLDSSGEIKYALDAVEDASGRALPVARKWNDVLVQLPAPLEPGQSVELTFRMSGDVLYRPLRNDYWALTHGWYPSGTHLQNSAFTYHATVKVPKPFAAFTSASTVRRWEERDLACAEFAQAKTIRQAQVLAGKYTTHVDAREGLTVRVSSYGVPKPGATKQMAALVHAFVASYEPLLGKLPFAELDVLEVNALGFGVLPENDRVDKHGFVVPAPGLIFIPREVFNPQTGYVSEEFVRSVHARLAHEVAHAWWAHVVRPAGVADWWMTESLAQYYSALAVQQVRDPKDFDRMLDLWKEDAKPVRGGGGSVYLAHVLAGEDKFEEYNALLHGKGPLLLHALRQELGDQAFFTVFKSLVSSFQFKDATTADVIAITKLVAKKDYGPWFERYLLGSEWPSPEKGKSD
jgi:hypothetical protein